MKRSKLFLAAAAAITAACEAPTAPSANKLQADGSALGSSSTATTFSGEATVVRATVTPLGIVTPITINLVETGKLPESGGALDATLLELDISKEETGGLLELGARVGHASTVGQGKNSRSQATVADLSIDVAGTRIEAAFLQALAEAACDALGNAAATAGSTIANLSINGTPVTVGTGPDQELIDLPALRVVANEQSTKSGGANDADITVNALHITAYAVNLDGSRGAALADIVVASAHADIHCGLCTDRGDDFTTGGGWFRLDDTPQTRKHFAVAGGHKNGDWWGHLTYMDKAANVHVKGEEVYFYENSTTPHGNRSVIKGRGHLRDGSAVHYVVTVEDNGEPGRADTFHIVLSRARDDGAAAFYMDGGTLGGGNVQFHDKPSRCPVD